MVDGVRQVEQGQIRERPQPGGGARHRPREHLGRQSGAGEGPQHDGYLSQLTCVPVEHHMRGGEHPTWRDEEAGAEHPPAGPVDPDDMPAELAGVHSGLHPVLLVRLPRSEIARSAPP